MATTTVFSKRIHKSQLDNHLVHQIQSILSVVNDAKIKAYAHQMCYPQNDEESIHLFIKRIFNLNKNCHENYKRESIRNFAEQMIKAI